MVYYLDKIWVHENEPTFPTRKFWPLPNKKCQLTRLKHSTSSAGSDFGIPPAAFACKEINSSTKHKTIKVYRPWYVAWFEVDFLWAYYRKGLRIT